MAISGTWRRALEARADEWVARRVQAAQRDVEAAAERYRALRVAAAEGTPCVDAPAPRRPLSTWQQLLLLVVGGGLLLGLLVMWLLATAYVGPVALLVLPSSAGLVTAFVVLRRRHPRAPRTRRRPVVADLVRAAQEVHNAELALERARAWERPGPTVEPAAGGAQRSAPRPVGDSQVVRDRVPWPRVRRGAQEA